MKYLVAPNAFKNALSAVNAALHISAGLKRAEPNAEIFQLPIADGGDGSLECLAEIIHADIKTSIVEDPLGRPIEAQWAYSEKRKTAIIEMATASGIALLKPDELDPMKASTFGTGELIQAALDLGAREIIIGLGGSATVDGGVGCLQALGFHFLNENGTEVPKGAQGLDQIAEIVFKEFTQLPKITILCDVKNPLLGEKGSAKVFGPQKGADADMVEKLEKGLANFRKVVLSILGHDLNAYEGGGAAGGIASALKVFLKGQFVSGAEYILDLAKVDDLLAQVDYVITGEGKIDSQTDQGKAPHALALRAKKHSKPVFALGGMIEENLSTELFDSVININKANGPLKEMLKATSQNLERTAYELADELWKGK